MRGPCVAVFGKWNSRISVRGDGWREGEAMTDQEINVAIAEVCGVCLHLETTHYVCQSDSGFTCNKCRKDTYGLRRLNYVEDLNAMREAEGILGKEADGFGRELASIVLGYSTSAPSHDLNYLEVTLITHASARQRAEAFLRTLGKWKD